MFTAEKRNAFFLHLKPCCRNMYPSSACTRFSGLKQLPKAGTQTLDKADGCLSAVLATTDDWRLDVLSGVACKLFQWHWNMTKYLRSRRTYEITRRNSAGSMRKPWVSGIYHSATTLEQIITAVMRGPWWERTKDTKWTMEVITCN